ncbi:uncharacterized protein LOC124622744 [Schistocerca americana]|uniref:uncharacterized protein LOC124622744 n=1 Tax=Schistocerca americana TaxID=7009 RepID=UPI001F502B2F|nr:uncharacterized protein LOC124622744 [Schistocerca americana]
MAEYRRSTALAAALQVCKPDVALLLLRHGARFAANLAEEDRPVRGGKTGEEVFRLTSGIGVPKDKETWWWNEEVQKFVKEKKDAKRKWDMSGSAEDGQAYKSAKKEAKRAVAKAKAESVREAYEQPQKSQDMRQLIRIGKSRDKASKNLTAIKRKMKQE